MNTEQRIAEEVEKTLESYGGDIPLEGRTWLPARILAARYARNTSGAHRRHVRMELRLAAALALVLLNLVTLAWYGWGRQGSADAELAAQLRAEFQMDQTDTNF